MNVKLLILPTVIMASCFATSACAVSSEYDGYEGYHGSPSRHLTVGEAFELCLDAGVDEAAHMGSLDDMDVSDVEHIDGGYTITGPFNIRQSKNQTFESTFSCIVRHGQVVQLYIPGLD